MKFIVRQILIFSCFLFAFLCLSSLSLKGQSQILGQVSSTEGEPLHGVNLLIVESGEGTSTDRQGRFALSIKESGLRLTIKASFVGYATALYPLYVETSKKHQVEIELVPLVINVEPVEISAKAESRPLNVPMRIEIIGKKEIEALPALTIDQTMVSSPGVNVNRDFGIFSDRAVVTLRGQSGSDQSRTLVLVDGIPVNKSDGGSVNWNFIQPEMVESVEISKGPASAKYGSGAMGGAINMITSRPIEPFNVEAEAEAGQWNTFGGRVRVSGNTGDSLRNPLWYSVSGMVRTSDGYVNQPEETIIMYDSVVVPAFLKEEAAQVKLVYRINENHQVDVDANLYNDKHGQGIKIYEEDGSWSSHQTWFAKAGYKGQIGQWTVDAKAYYLLENYYKVNEYFSEGEYTLYDVDSKRNDWGGILHFSGLVNGHHKVSLGGELRQGRVDASDIYYTASDKIDNRGQMDLAGFFVMDEMSFFDNTLQVNAGLRFDAARFSKGLYRIQDPSYSLEYLLNFQDTLMNDNAWMAVNPKLSVNYLFSSGLRTYLSAASGFRAPVLDDLCRSGRRKNGFRLANPELSPEYITSFEWGFDWRVKDRWHFGLSAFYSLGRDYMYAISTGDSVNMGYLISPVYKTQNISGVDISGIEAELSGKISKDITFFANYTRNFTRISDFIPQTAADPDLTGNHLTDVPDHQANAGVGWRNSFVDFYITGKYVGQRWINDRNIPDVTYLLAPQYPAYFNLDLKIQKQISPHWRLSLSLQNIFNEIHINSQGYKTPGRFVMGKLSWNLGG
jgi:iron complex outermembrane receptor protein